MSLWFAVTDSINSCRRRKIKCNSRDVSPCQSCAAADLACTYNKIPQKTGPRGDRTRVKIELRNEQRNAPPGGETPQEQGGGGISCSHHVRELLTPTLLKQCVDSSFVNIYPLQPVLARRQVDEAAMTMSWSTIACCMVLALCACTMVQRDMELLSSLKPSETHHVECVLLQESCRLRKVHDHYQNPTQQAVLVS